MGKEEMMRLKLFVLVLLLILSFNLAYANPLVELFLNEVLIDSTEWKIELKNLDLYFQSLDSCFLSTTTDTAYFIPGISTSDSFLVITQDSLINSLNINRLGDIIGFHFLDNYPISQIGFGNISGWSVVATPYYHQSICLNEWYDLFQGQDFFYYLDNTPTIGQKNDFINASGYIKGNVLDSTGNPIRNAPIYSGHDFSTVSVYVQSDSNGHFILRDTAYIAYLRFYKQNYQTEFLTVQIWPEDTVTINVTLNPVIDAIESIHNHSLNEYKLSQNYPNPFNNSTYFSYALPKADFVEINIYDLTGKLVEKLFTGEQNRGEYKVNWNAESVASGIYIYQIKTNQFINHKKCLLIK
jgi:hypothetical protein